MAAAARRQRSEPMPAHAHSPTHMLLGSFAGTSDGGERLETDVVPNSKDDSGSRTTQEAQLHWHRAVRDPAKCSCLRWLAVIHLSRSYRGGTKAPHKMCAPACGQIQRASMPAHSHTVHSAKTFIVRQTTENQCNPGSMQRHAAPPRQWFLYACTEH